jgi:hypothetical protein
VILGNGDFPILVFDLQIDITIWDEKARMPVEEDLTLPGLVGGLVDALYFVSSLHQVAGGSRAKTWVSGIVFE